MSTADLNELSERELDILKLVATGASNKEIAQILFISSNTVKVHLRNIFSKIGANSRTEAAMFAVHSGLVKNPSDALIAVENFEPTVVDMEIETPITREIALDSVSTKSRLPRWTYFLFIALISGVLFLGLRLSPGLAIFNQPSTPIATPQNTITPLPRWRNLASLPNPRSSLAVVAYANQIYAIGGLTNQGIYAGIDRFDPLTNSWETLSPKLTPVYNVQAEVINGLIYVPGGRTDMDDLQPSNILEIYDSTTDRWMTGTAMPVSLSGYGLIAFEGELFVFGGWDGHNYVNTVYSYDPSQDEWQERTPMPSARAFPGVAEAGGRVYIIGGIFEDQSVTANEIYSPSRDNAQSNPWSTGFPLPENRLGIQTATIADTIYVFGDETQSTHRGGLIYFPQTDVWQSLEASPDPLGEDFAVASIGTNLFFMGGKINQVFSDRNITYQAIITLSIPIIIK